MYVQYVQFFVGSFPTLQYGPRGVDCFNQINKSKNYATSSAIRIFSIFFLFKNRLESFPDCQNVILHISWALYHVYMVIEMTMNMAEYGSQRSDQPENINFEQIIRGLKSDIFDGD